MNELIDISALQSMPVQQLKNELFNIIEMTVFHLNKMAAIWRELEVRGENMSELRSGIALYVEMIAHKKIDANLVVKYAGKKVLLNALAKLTPEEQKKIAEDDRVEIAYLENDEMIVNKMSLSAIPSASIYTVFSEHGIRSVIEQQKILLKRDSKPVSKKRKYRKIFINKNENTIEIGHSAADINNVIAAIEDHFSIDIQKLINE